jgi:hypothetical protein
MADASLWPIVLTGLFTLAGSLGAIRPLRGSISIPPNFPTKYFFLSAWGDFAKFMGWVASTIFGPAPHSTRSALDVRALSSFALGLYGSNGA